MTILTANGLVACDQIITDQGPDHKNIIFRTSSPKAPLQSNLHNFISSSLYLDLKNFQYITISFNFFQINLEQN